MMLMKLARALIRPGVAHACRNVHGHTRGRKGQFSLLWSIFLDTAYSFGCNRSAMAYCAIGAGCNPCFSLLCQHANEEGSKLC